MSEFLHPSSFVWKLSTTILWNCNVCVSRCFAQFCVAFVWFVGSMTQHVFYKLFIWYPRMMGITEHCTFHFSVGSLVMTDQIGQLMKLWLELWGLSWFHVLFFLPAKDIHRYAHADIWLNTGRGKAKRERKVKKKNHKRISNDIPMANAVDEPLYVVINCSITYLHAPSSWLVSKSHSWTTF